MAKPTGKLHGVRMGLKSAIKRTKRRAVKKAGMDASAGPTPAPPPMPSMPKINPTAYFRSKKKKKKDIPSPGLTLMPAAGATMPSMSAGATMKSEVVDEFKPVFLDIKELAKTAPHLALSCMSIETLSKQNAMGQMATSVLNAFGGTKTDKPAESKPTETASSGGGGMAAAINRAGAKTSAAGGNVPSQAMGKAAMPAGPKGPANPMPKGPKMAAPKAPPSTTPKPPTGPNTQLKPKGMGKEEKDMTPAESKAYRAGHKASDFTDVPTANRSAIKPASKPAIDNAVKDLTQMVTSGKMKPVNKEEMDKGDVVRIKDKKVISTDTKPASPLRTGQQHKASQYTPMKPAAVAADGTRVNKEEKGVHKPFMGNKGSGTSAAGYEVRDSKLSDQAYHDKKIAGAKDKHTKVLADLKAQPKPKLGKEEKGKEVKRPDAPQVSAGGGKNFPVKEHKESGMEGLNIVTPPNGTKDTKKKEDCYEPSEMIKEELAQKWEPRFKKPQ